MTSLVRTNPAYKNKDLENFFEKKRRKDDFEKAKLLWESSGQLGKIAQTSPKNVTRKNLTWAQKKKKSRKDAKAAIAKVKANKTRKISKNAETEYALTQSTWARGELEKAIEDKRRHDKEQKRGKPLTTRVGHWFQKKMGSKAKKRRDALRDKKRENEMRASHVYNATREERVFQEQRRKKKEEKEKDEKSIEKEKQDNEGDEDDEDASRRRIKLKDSLQTMKFNKRPSKINMPAPPVPPLPEEWVEKEKLGVEGGGRTRRRKRKRRRKTKKKKKRRRRTKKKKNKKRRRTKKRRRK